MANTPDLTSCLEPGPVQDDAILPINPFLSVRYQFGMLLGAEDFDAAEAYPRGKVRLHNAWLHGPGVVWGFGVSAPAVSTSDPTLTGEIQVSPGLALDRLGHELHLDQAACVDVGAWYAAHKDDADLAAVTQPDPNTSGGFITQLHIELRFRACLTRPVPAMSEPCDGAGGSDTAYSRAFETVEIKLVPGPAPARVDDYPLLRLLFQVRPDPATPTPAEADAIATRNAVTDQLSFLAAFRKLAALDGVAMQPGSSAAGKRLLFPGGEDAPLMLADLKDVTLAPDGSGFKMTAVKIDQTVRQAHVATSTIQELNCCSGTAGGGGAPHPEPSVAPNPSARAELDASDARVIRLISLTRAFDESTVEETAFSVTQLTGDGWSTLDIHTVDLDPSDARQVVIRLRAEPAGTVLRFIARGTGPTPLMYAASGTEKTAPFRGNNGAGTDWDGSDFVYSWEGK